MNENEHVYCVDCKHFRTDDEYKSYCPYEPECDIWNCEDSKPLRKRPYYEEKYNPCKTCGTQRCFPEYCNILHPEIKIK